MAVRAVAENVQTKNTLLSLTALGFVNEGASECGNRWASRCISRWPLATWFPFNANSLSQCVSKANSCKRKHLAFQKSWANIAWYCCARTLKRRDILGSQIQKYSSAHSAWPRTLHQTHLWNWQKRFSRLDTVLASWNRDSNARIIDFNTLSISHAIVIYHASHIAVLSSPRLPSPTATPSFPNAKCITGSETNYKMSPFSSPRRSPPCRTRQLR